MSIDFSVLSLRQMLPHFSGNAFYSTYARPCLLFILEVTGISDVLSLHSALLPCCLVAFLFCCLRYIVTYLPVCLPVCLPDLLYTNLVVGKPC